jgi:tetratricopeptide (TPR) repeat protein
VQALVGSVSCVLVGAATSRLVSPRAGLVAGLGLALYAPAIFFDGLIQKSVLDVFFLSLALWLMSRVIDRRQDAGQPLRSWLMLGLAMGGLALTRENAMVLVAVLSLWALAGIMPDGSSERPPFASRATAAGAMLLGVALVLAPVALRNYSVGGGFYVTTSQFGPNFYIGNNPRSDGTYLSLRYGRGSPEYERQDATELAEHAMGRALSPAEVSAFWTNRAMAFITSQPGAWLKLVGRKFVLLWNADEMLDTESQESYAEWSAPLALLSWFGHFGVLVPLAVAGVWTTWPDRRRLWVFYLMMAAYSASVIMFYVFARYRFPLVPMLMLFAGAGIVGVASFIRATGWLEPLGQLFSTGAGAPPPARTDADAVAAAVQAAARHGRRRSRVPAAAPSLSASAIVFATAVFANWPILSKAMMQAVTENNLATAFQESGRLDDAIAHYRRALEFQSDYAPAYNNMGVALRAQGDIEQAKASYEKALAVQPDYPDAHYNLANALLDQNKPDEAAAHFRTALASIPGSAGSLNNLGIALANQGKLEEAAAQFRAALAVEPNSAKAHRNLGNVLSSMGRRDEAVQHLRRAVDVDPNDADAHYDLGNELLEANQLPAAAAEFQAAVKLAPDSAPAHNNLGIALASQGRVEEAIAQFREAVRADPSFPDARRNLDIALAQKKEAGR